MLTSDRLLDYQIEGAKWLADSRHSYLADDMGVGKTAQAICACDMVNAQSILVVCPAVARINWLREFSKWSIFSRPATAIMDQRSTPVTPGLSAVSYDLATRNASNWPNTWDVIICDEAHYIKHCEANRTRVILGKSGLVRRTQRLWCISGTPAPNHPGELWPVFYTFGWTGLSYDEWVARYCTGYQYRDRFQITGAKNKNIPELRQIIHQHLLRRTKKQVMHELPPITYQTLPVEPGEVDLETSDIFIRYVFPKNRRGELEQILTEQRQMVESGLKYASTRRATGREAYNIIEGMAESVSTLRQYIGLQKVEEVADLVASELSDNAYEKIVLFAIHKDVIEGLRTRLSKFKPVTLYGGTPPAKRQMNIDKFQQDPKCRVFIGNIQAAGTAVTLTAANHVMLVEQSWVPGENAQAVMRVHRKGQEYPVTVRLVMLHDTFDERVNDVLKRKMNELTEIFGE